MLLLLLRTVLIGKASIRTGARSVGQVSLGTWATNAHLLCAIVLDEGVKWYHTVNLQKHWCGAQLLFPWPAAKVTGRRTSALLLTSNLHT